MEMKNLRVIFLAAGLVGFAAGCKPSGPAENPPTAKDYANAAVTNAAAATSLAWAEAKADFESAMDYSYDKKDEFTAKTKADLQTLDDKIQKLSDRAASASDATRADLQTKLQDLRAKRAVLDQKLTKLKNATDADWNDAKVGFQNAYDDVKTSVTNAWHSVTGS